ncbi:twin-arginine translocation signal domain-containing protein, partial [Eggerthella sinensis]
MDRRGFLKGAALTGVGAAVAGLGLAGCAPKTEAATDA